MHRCCQQIFRKCIYGASLKYLSLMVTELNATDRNSVHCDYLETELKATGKYFAHANKNTFSRTHADAHEEFCLNIIYMLQKGALK